ncbi:hypothetical protein GBA52_001305 [Prunus armeniaca]|nr:hypothetical protein GBA52_001305 [Prunus armeniaca]
MGISAVACIVLSAILMLNAQQSNGALSAETQMLIEEANMSGPYLGLVIPNSFEMDPLLQSPNFTSSNLFIDFSGRRFRFGTIANKQVILVMTGLSMLLLSVFNIEGVVHYGIAGHANPSFNLADVVIPQYWSHSALWSWQRYGKGPQDELPLEANGDYTREFGYLNVANYTELELERCLNATTCLPHTPKVSRVQRGTSASIFLSNAAYRSFLYDKFNITPLDMESASVALICLQQRVPFIAIRSLSSSLTGGGSGDPNEASKFITLASKNSVTAVVEFIKQLSLHQLLINH